LKKIRAERDNKAVEVALSRLEAAARHGLTRAAGTTRSANGDDNMLTMAIEAAKARATVGEISDTLEKVLLTFTIIIDHILISACMHVCMYALLFGLNRYLVVTHQPIVWLVARIRVSIKAKMR
jgi:hypothetical protein